MRREREDEIRGIERNGKMPAAIRNYAAFEIGRIIAEVMAGELTGDAISARFARLKAELDTGLQ